ncbi:MAG: ETC complex I subunit [Pseudomonadota bacterium]
MKVRIYKPAKNTMQSGLRKTKDWVLEYQSNSQKKPEPLMGWISSDDTLNQVQLKFPTKEAAIAHAEEEGWEYTVSTAQERKVKPRSYMDNFKYFPPEEAN